MALTNKLTAIANAIREKTGETSKLTLDQMPTAIENIETGGEVGNKTITQNGYYSAADDNLDGYDVVRVNVVNENLPKITDGSYLFYNRARTDYYDQFISLLDNITSMYYMFYNYKNAYTAFTLDLKPIDMSKVTNLEYAFANNYYINTIDMTNANTSSATTLSSAFRGNEFLKNIIGIENIDTSKLQFMEYVFYNCSRLENIDISNWNVSNVQSMQYMFYNAHIGNTKFDKWNTSKLQYMSYMFYGVKSNSDTLDISNLNVGKINSASSVFTQCYIPNIVANNLEFSVLTSNTMFNDTGTKYVEIKNWKVPKMTTIASMFRYAKQVEKVDMSNWETGVLNNMSYLFQNAAKLKTVIFGNFDTSKVTNMSYMFSGCTLLESLDLSGFDTTKVNNNANMFLNCSSLKALIINNPNVFKLTASSALTGSGIQKKTGYVYVPDDLVDTYKTTTNWTYFADQIKGISELPDEYK